MCLPHLEEWAVSAGLVAPRIVEARAARLADFKLAWNYRSRRKWGAANVVREAGNVVHGVLLTTDEIGLATIDRKEGTPTYYARTLEKIDVGGSLLDAWVYQVTDRWLQPPPVWPSREYLNLILAGARAHDLPADYVSALASVPVIEAA
jgi:gamma-glutamylcyclotransferase (GGCT)/AIG2-like uncharacterized protein YtfP